MKVVAGAEQETQLLEGETLRSEVREEAAVVVVVTELTAGGNIRDLGERGEKVFLAQYAGFTLQPAGVGGELGLELRAVTVVDSVMNSPLQTVYLYSSS